MWVACMVLKIVQSMNQLNLILDAWQNLYESLGESIVEYNGDESKVHSLIYESKTALVIYRIGTFFVVKSKNCNFIEGFRTKVTNTHA